MAKNHIAINVHKDTSLQKTKGNANCVQKIISIQKKEETARSVRNSLSRMRTGRSALPKIL